MSSILDALNKLEQEKAQASREAERSDTDPISVANDLVGRSVMRERVTLRVTPVGLLLSVGALVVGLVVITFAAAVMFTSSRVAEPAATAASPRAEITDLAFNAAPATPRAQITDLGASAPVSTRTQITDLSANATPASARVQITDISANTAPVANANVTPPPPAPAPEAMTKIAAATPAPIAPAPETAKPEPAPVAVAEKKPEPKKVASTPKPRAPEVEVAGSPAADDSDSAESTEADPPPTKVSAATSPRTRTRTAKTAESTRAPGPDTSAPRAAAVKLETLPTLTQVDQTRYGFVRLKVNMVKPAGETNPQGSAILSFVEEGADGQAVPNRMRFYEGQRIQNSPLRLFKIGADRVGLEDMRTGDQYQLPI